MSEEVKDNGQVFLKGVKEFKLPIGEILELEDGMSVYVVPIAELGELKDEDWTKVKRKIKARELVRQADELTEKRVKEGWTEEDFRRDFLETRERIIEFLRKKYNASKKRK